MPVRSIVCTIALAAALTAPFAAAQQNLVQAQGQILYLSGPSNGLMDGDLAPGLLGGVRFGGGGQDNAVVDGNGNAFFRARLLSNTGMTLAPVYLQYAYYYGSDRNNLSLVLRGGDPEPSGTVLNAILSTSTSGAPFTGSPRISENGHMLFGASIWDFIGNTVSAPNDNVLYAGTPGNFQMLAREGDLAPGCGGATYSTAFSSMSQQSTGINSSGVALFKSSLAGASASPPVAVGNNEAWFTGTPGNVQLVLRKGDSYPWIAGGATISALGFISQMNPNGWITTEVTLAQGTGTPAVTAADDRALLLYQPGIGLTQIMREGDPTPIPGTTYNVASNSWFFNTGSSTFNAAGELLLIADIAGAVTAGVDDRILIKASAAGQSVVMRRGDAAPGVAGANWDVINNSSLCLNDAGQVAFQATLLNGGVSATNDSGIWMGGPGNWSLVAREGDAAPGTAATFGQTTAVTCLLNGKGQVLFANSLLPGNLGSSWLWDANLGAQRIFAAGDQIEVNPGVFRSPYTAGTNQSSNGDGRSLSFTNDGTAVVKLSMNDGTSYGSQLMVGLRLGSLTGLPSALSETTGGTHSLYLNAGLANAGFTYVVAGSISGTSPGIPIGSFVLPLNFDFYTQFTLDNANIGLYVNTFSTLDADGRRGAQILVPPLPGLAGLVFNHAYGVLDLSSQLVFVSEPASLTLTP